MLSMSTHLNFIIHCYKMQAFSGKNKQKNGRLNRRPELAAQQYKNGGI